MAKKLTDEQRAEIARENGKLGGTSFKYTSEELTNAIDAYFANHNSDDNKPDWDDMLRSLGVSKSTSERYLYDEEYKKLGYEEAIKKGIGYFTSFWTKYGLEHPNTQSFCIFMLKQVHYGGFADKQQVETTGKQSIEVTIKSI